MAQVKNVGIFGIYLIATPVGVLSILKESAPTEFLPKRCPVLRNIENVLEYINQTIYLITFNKKKLKTFRV